MKKIALSLIALAASGAYVWVERGPLATADDRLTLVPAKVDGKAAPAPSVSATRSIPTDVVPPRTKDESLLIQRMPAETPLLVRSQAFDLPTPASSTTPPNVPLPRVRPATVSFGARVVPAAMAVAAGLADGTFTGPPADAYYGEVQVEAIVQDGRIAAIKVLQYPSDRRTSVVINRQALPMLRDEVISAQVPNVDIISGATLTSEAFIQSLTAALRGARA